MTIITPKTCWIAFGVALCTMYFGYVPPTYAAGSVPVVNSTATPPPCTGTCRKVNPDVISMTDLPGGVPSDEHLPSVAIFAAKAKLVFTGITKFPNELDIELRAEGGAHETVHVPSADPPTAFAGFPRKALLDSVIEVTKYTRILYRAGHSGKSYAVSVSQPVSVSAPVFITIP